MKVIKMLTREANDRARNTDSVICKGCGEVITSDYCYAVDGLKGYSIEGKLLHFCPPCTERVHYHDERRENRTGTQNYTWIREGDTSLEIETCSQFYNTWLQAILNDMDFAEVYFTIIMMGYQRTGKSQQIENDCTNHGEGHARGRDLYSVSKWFYNRTEGQLDTMRDARCGCHMHVSCIYHFSDNIWFEIFNPVYQCMKFNGDESKMIEYWGRTFTHYARESKGYHGDAINWHTGYDTVEFRLPHVRTADQIIRCVKFWRACVNVVNKWGYKVVDEKTAAHLGQKIVKQCFIPLVNGTKFYKGY